MIKIIAFISLLSVISAIEPPGEIILTDPDGNVIKDIVLVQYMDSGYYHFACEVQHGNWTFDPALPDGMGFTKNRGILSGTPIKLMEKTEYTLTVANEAGVSTLSFSITVNECKYGFYIIRKVFGYVHVAFKHDGVLLEDKDIKINDQEHYYCLPEGNLDYNVTCLPSTPYDCIGELLSSNGTVFSYIRLKKGESKYITTDMHPKGLPTISVDKNDVVVAIDTLVEVFFTVTDVHDAIYIEPDLGDDLFFDGFLYSIRGTPKHRGAFTYKITASNIFGNATIQWTVYSDACPPGKELLRLRGTNPIKGGYSILNDKDEELVSEILPSYRMVKSYCFVKGTYFFLMKNNDSLPWEASIESYDLRNNVIETFQKNNLLKEQKERFILGDAIDTKDELVYIVANTIDEKWVSKDFDDSTWKRGVGPHWGPYGDEKTFAYFRKQFTIDNPHKISQVLVETLVEDEFEMYLNGKLIRQFTRGFNETQEVPTQLLFSSTLLEQGVNQLAVSLYSEEPKDILFSLKLHLITSQCLRITTAGKTTSDEEEPTTYPAEGAFNYGFRWWESTQIPVNLYHQNTNDTFIMPSQMTISSKKDSYEGRPLAFTVFGQVINHSTDEVLFEDVLGEVNAKSFLIGVKTEIVPLYPKRPYNSFRILFSKSSNTTALRVFGISFLTCQEDMCPKAGSIPSVRVGSVIPHKCSHGTYGINQYTCGRKDVEPHWEEDTHMCIPTQATKGLAFVDMTVHIEGMRAAQLPAVKTAVEEWMPEYLVKKENITYPVVSDFMGETSNVNITMRIQVDDIVGPVLLRVINNENQSFIKHMRVKLINEGCTSFKVIDGPVLFEAPEESSSSTPLLVVIFICGMIVAFICGYRVHKCNSKAKKEEEHVLLQSNV